ncbi:cation-translocating P-type ATPase [Lentisphaerota bacterium WC36G]|nr:cation-translocating P-type ATPase [Lentisphaerae bacterium WC36]
MSENVNTENVQDNNSNVDLLTDGHGHERSMATLSLAIFGGIFILNSYILLYLLPKQPYPFFFSALIGSLILAVPIIFTSAKELLKGKVTMNSLVALAVVSAFSSGNFQEAGIISFFLMLTIIIETKTASGAQRSIEELIKLTPPIACQIINGEEIEVDVLELKIGDIIRVRPGDNFPIDGKIIKGESTVNQASITGESIPVDKVAGDDIFAGTQNLTGSVDIEVTKVGQDTTLGQVKDMILAAESSKSPIVRVIDNYIAYYTPTILMIAGLAYFLSSNNEEAIQKVISVLVIACPCAIVLATPSATVAAVAAAARLGIFIKNISHLELASKIRTFVFDKTGTLTDGILSVAKLQGVEGVSPAQLLKAGATAEAHSNHPTAMAISKLAAEAGIKLPEVDKFEEVHGKGVIAYDGDDVIRVGRYKWLKSLGLELPEEEHDPEAEGMSVVHVTVNGKNLGWIGMKDKLRKESGHIIDDLRLQGVKHCAMVTGDRHSVAVNVADKLSLDHYESECLPETKVAYVEKVKENSLVAVVGDGVNDAPALAAGDLGIAMGAIGSDIAINSASIALMTNDLRRIPMLMTLSKKSKIIINQNLFIGMLCVFGGIILAMFNILNPIMAAVIHTISTVVVIFNSARLVRTGEELTFEENLKQKEKTDEDEEVEQ